MFYNYNHVKQKSIKKCTIKSNSKSTILTLGFTLYFFKSLKTNTSTMNRLGNKIIIVSNVEPNMGMTKY